MSEFFRDDIEDKHVYPLSSSEIFLVETYRTLDSRQQELLIAYLAGLANVAFDSAVATTTENEQ